MNHYDLLIYRSRHQELSVYDQWCAFREGVAGAYNVRWRGRNTPTFSTESTLPTGFSLSSAGVLAYDGSASTQGDYEIPLEATDGETTVSAVLTASLNPSALVVGDQSCQFFLGVATAYEIAFSSDFTPSFAVASGTLPAGVTLADGVLSYDGTGGSASASVTMTATAQYAEPVSFTLSIAMADEVVVRFAAGVDTTLYLTDADGILTATPSGDWGGTGYHDGIRGTWVSFYPKHGLKYSFDGGTTYQDWCFEDTSATLDLTPYGITSIMSVSKVSGRDTVSLSGQQITVNDPSSSSAIYIFDVTFNHVAPEASDSGSGSNSEIRIGALVIEDGTYAGTYGASASEDGCAAFVKAGTGGAPDYRIKFFRAGTYSGSMTGDNASTSDVWAIQGGEDGTWMDSFTVGTHLVVASANYSELLGTHGWATDGYNGAPTTTQITITAIGYN